MAFGQQVGPPASARQLADLLRLLQGAGHTGFRDARGPMGFTQRQGGGKFSNAEAASFIEQLEEAEGVGDEVEASTAPARRRETARPSVVATSLLGDVSAEQLAAELCRRGWVVTPP